MLPRISFLFSGEKNFWAKIESELILLFQEVVIVQILPGNINRRTNGILAYIYAYLILALSTYNLWLIFKTISF
jgi:hypothetical protein